MNKLDLKNAFAPCPAHFEARIRYTMREMEQLTMKRKHKARAALVLALILIALAGTALALVSWRDAARHIVEVEQTDGYYEDWPADQKATLVSALVAQGYVENTERIGQLLAGALPEAEAHQVADEAVTAFTRQNLYDISFMGIMNAAWGPFEQWTLEEQAWYSQLMVDMGLQGQDHTLYVMPIGPVDETQAVAIARREIARVWGVAESALDAYTLTTSFQVPEFAEPGDTQAWWYVDYSPPAGLPEEQRVFPSSFWVFIHPETGALYEPAEVLRDQIIAGQQAYAEWEQTPLSADMMAFAQQYGSGYWGSISLEGKAVWSARLAPQILAYEQAHPGFFDLTTLASAVPIYGVPDSQAISLEQALELAEQALIDPLGRRAEEIRFFLHWYDVYYDITHPERPLWKFFFHMPSQYDQDEDFGRDVKAYYGDQRVPNFKVELDARTGAVVAAFPFDWADEGRTVESFAKTM